MVEEWLEITGIVSSFVGIGLSFFLAFYIRYLDKKQRERDESFYKSMTLKNVNQLNEQLIEIQEMSESENDIPELDEQIEIVHRLNVYSSRNKRLLESLISDTRFFMSKWLSLPKTEKENIDYLINTTNWVLDEYLPKSNESENTQKRKLIASLSEFINRKNNASNKINKIIEKYS